MLEVFEAALPVLKKLEEHGYEAYFVGGSVRDFLIGREVDDVDIASAATPDEVKNIFDKTIDVGIEHGTVVVRHNKINYEITTFRTEGTYQDYRRPSEVEFVRNLDNDLERRDFTINALAMDSDGKIYDIFSGQEDLKSKTIRAVKDPVERFEEDALRMLRAVRFQAQLGFEIEEQTFEAIRLKSRNLAHISQERITVEFEKTLMSANPELGIRSLVQSSLHDSIPFLTVDLAKIQFNNLDTLFEKWAKICIELNIHPKELFSAWKCSNEKMKTVSAIVNCYKAVRADGWDELKLFRYGLTTSQSVVKLLQHEIDIEARFNKLPIKSAKEICVNGHHLQNICGRPAGPWMKEVLDLITDNIVIGNIANEREAIVDFLKSEGII